MDCRPVRGGHAAAVSAAVLEGEPLPISHRVDRERGLVYFTVSGEISLGEIVTAVDAALADPDYDTSFGILSDHTAIAAAVTRTQLEGALAHLLERGMAGSRWAMVVARDASFGMMRMLSVMAEAAGVKVEVFRDRDAAERWLLETDR